MIPIGLFINNQFQSSVSGKKFESFDPSTAQSIVSVYEADDQDVDIAVKCANEVNVIMTLL